MIMMKPQTSLALQNLCVPVAQQNVAIGRRRANKSLQTLVDVLL